MSYRKVNVSGEELERAYRKCSTVQVNVTQLARELGVSRGTAYRLLKKRAEADRKDS